MESVLFGFESFQRRRLLFGGGVGNLRGDIRGISGADDANGAAYGTSFESIDHSYKLDVSYAHKFFGDNETRVTLFGERRSGRPTSFVMSDATSGRGPVFGVNRGNFLLYVPKIAGEVSSATDLDVGLVTFDSVATRDNFLNAVSKFGMTEDAIQEKGSFTNHDINQVDLQLSQELPSPISGHKLRLTWDIAPIGLAVSANWRYFGSVKLDTNTDDPNLTNGRTNFIDGVIGAKQYLDLSGTYILPTADRNIALRFGISNVGGQNPPILSSNNPNPISSPPDRKSTRLNSSHT